MERITLNIENRKSEVYIGKDWKTVNELLPAGGYIIITDENVRNIYGKDFPVCPVISVKPGEESKNLNTLGRLAQGLLGAGIDRSGFVLGIGGGVVCDIAGFLASVYMRGIKFGFVSTSLLSQVDASVGGKNAVNVEKVKNILGCFRQPEFVICDQKMLKTLPEDEYISGLAELIKTAVILDAELFSLIGQNVNRIKNADPGLLEDLIAKAVRLKASVVTEDEREITGKRMILNFGHTFGHVIETVTGMKHGFAVACGMAIACDISSATGYMSTAESERIKSLLNEFGLLKKHGVTAGQFGKMLLTDKKKEGSRINFVMAGPVGRAEVVKMEADEILKIYRSVISSE